jgi:hypothetical protein
MAFSATDTDCIEKAHAYLVKRQQRNQLDETEKAHLATIVTGDETAKTLVAKWYAEYHVLTGINGRLAVIDSEKTDLESDKTLLDAYIAE